jgi:hypothetical protein
MPKGYHRIARTDIYSRQGEEDFSMFESLNERIRIDEASESTPKQRMIRYGVIGLISLVVIVILYEAVRLLG